MSPASVYRPAKSQGRLWLAALGGPGLLLGIIIVYSALVTGLVVFFVVGGLTVGLGLTFLLPFLWVPSMRYELDNERLVMRCGPIRYTIRLADVRRVVKQDLAFSPWSSMRLPGFALGDVVYGDVGHVTMCSTRALRGVVLIETGGGKFGLSPDNEGAFLADLRNRLDTGPSRPGKADD